MARSFVRGFAAVARDAIAPHVQFFMACMVLVGLTLGAGIVFRLDLIATVWIGVLAFIALGVILWVKNFVASCLAHEAAEYTPAERKADKHRHDGTPVRDNVLPFPGGANCRNISN